MIGWLPARERWRWLLLVPVAGLAALIEAAGALAVFGLLRLVVDPEQVRTAPVVSRLWAMWPTEPRSLVALLALGVGAFYVLRAVFLGWAEWTRQGIVYRSSAVAAERLLARYLAADYLFHARRRSASLIEPMARASDIAYELGAGSAVNILAEVVIIARARRRADRFGAADHAGHGWRGARAGAGADRVDAPVVGTDR